MRTYGHFLIALSAGILLVGCGPDAMTAAGTQAATEAQAAKQAQAQKDQLEAKIKAAEAQSLKQAADGEKADEASK